MRSTQAGPVGVSIRRARAEAGILPQASSRSARDRMRTDLMVESRRGIRSVHVLQGRSTRRVAFVRWSARSQWRAMTGIPEVRANRFIRFGYAPIAPAYHVLPVLSPIAQWAHVLQNSYLHT